MPEYTREEVVRLIRAFLDGSCGERDWDDFTSVKQKNTAIEQVRIRLIQIHDLFPSQNPREYCNDQGVQEMLEIIRALEKDI